MKLVFKDPAERKYKAEDLWLTGQNADHSQHPLMIAPAFPCFFFIFIFIFRSRRNNLYAYNSLFDY